MRKLIISGIVCSTLILTASLASAGSISSASSSAATSTGPMSWLSGFIIGVQPGYADTHYDRKWLLDQTGFTSVGSVSSRNYAARVFLGYAFNKFFSVEAGYLFLQGIVFKNINNVQDDDINQQIVDLVGKATLPMGYIGLYVKAGGAYVHRNELQIVNARYRANNKYVPVLGGGLSIFLTQNVTVGAEYDHYVKTGDFEQTDFFAATASYQFT